MLWAQDVDELVFPTVLKYLKTYSLSCEGEEDESQMVTFDAQERSGATGINSIPQHMVRRGSKNFADNRLDPNRSKTLANLLLSSEDERVGVPGDSMDDVDGSTSSVVPPVLHSNTRPSDLYIDECNGTEIERGIKYGNSPGIVRNGVPPSAESESLGVVTEETPSQATSPKPTISNQQPKTTSNSRTGRHSPAATRPTRTPWFSRDQKRNSSDLDPAPPPPPTINAFKDFFSTRKQRHRSSSVSSITSNASASAGSVRSGGNTSDDGRSGAIFKPTGILLPRPVAAAAVTTETTIKGLDEEEERRRQRRPRRERGTS